MTMMQTAPTGELLKGGMFLTVSGSSEEVFIPEELNEEQQMVLQMTKDFLEQEVFPQREQIEKQAEGVTPALLRKMGELGLLGAHMPEMYGGTALDTNTNTLIADVMGPAGSFSVALAAHTGIGMLPILYFGTDAQKEKYLPGLISGELKAAYCLTEPASGSDALAAKTHAVLSDDGSHYMLNGQKMWITNSGFADVFIVFAKIDGEKFTGFIVEKDSAGLTLGAEEDKMGIKGSSTRQVFFENVAVPVDQVLGEIGKGHLIAFNVLNIGRYKLGVLCTGGSKGVLTEATRYANERFQFGQPIANFGAIQYKLGEMATRIFASESAIYRASNQMHLQKEASVSSGKSYAEAMLDAAEEYAIECSILKILGSEVLDYCVDENVQIHGGIGFSEEYPAARAYRDSRINRIFEGTNEINRLLMVDMLLRRFMKGEIDLLTPIFEVQDEVSLGNLGENRPKERYAAAQFQVAQFKKVFLLTIGHALTAQTEGKLNLKEEQEILMNIADIITEIYTVESVLLRIEKLHQIKPDEDFSVYEAMLDLVLLEGSRKCRNFATDALAAFTDAELLEGVLVGIEGYTRMPAINVKAARRQVAGQLCKQGGWCFGVR